MILMEGDTTLRTCKVCGEAKPLDCYSVTGRKSSKTYRRHTCKSCWYETYYKGYVAANGDKIRAIVRRSMAKHVAANRDAINARRRKQYADNPDKFRAESRSNARRRRAANPEGVREYAKQWRESNPDKQRAITRRRYERHPEAFAEVSRRRKMIKRGAVGSHTRAEWLECVSAAGNKCKHCGVSGDDAKLTRDHIIPLTRGGSDFIENIQPLCLSCNCRKNNRLESELGYLKKAA